LKERKDYERVFMSKMIFRTSKAERMPIRPGIMFITPAELQEETICGFGQTGNKHL